MTAELSKELDHFLDSIDQDTVLEGVPEEDYLNSKNTLDTFKNEAKVALSLVKEKLSYEQNILEVGAGLCLLSLFLKSKGYSITALEPLSGGFGFFEQLKQKILTLNAELELNVVDKNVQDVTLEDDGNFDLIFSNNVVEHINELPEAMIAMKTVLKQDGLMIHGCPNYLIPYEPHFGIPVLSFIPGLTKTIWKNRIKEKIDVWDSLNFITYSRVRRIAKQIDCDVVFEQQLTYQAFTRLQGDSEFQERHKNTIVGKILRILERTGTLKLTQYLPAWASTPMIFTLSSKIK